MPLHVPFAVNVPSSLSASLPTPLEGRIGFPTDAASILRGNGSLYNRWGPIYSFVEPLDVLNSWVNQGSATVSQAKGIVFLKAPSNSFAFGVRGRVRNIGVSPPYTITMGSRPTYDNFANPGAANVSMFSGILLRESGTGELVTFGIGLLMNPDSPFSWQVQVNRYDSPSVYSATPAGTGVGTFLPGEYFWSRIRDDNTNRIYELSVDGVNWVLFYSESRTAFITADQFGYFLDPHGVGGALSVFSHSIG